MHPRYSGRMHSIGAMKVPFYKASLLRKRSAVDKSKSKYEWSEWSKRTYTYDIVSYHCNGHNIVIYHCKSRNNVMHPRYSS